MSGSTDPREQEVIATIRQIAAMGGTLLSPENPGVGMLILLITSYSMTLADYLMEGLVTLEEALVGTETDFDIVQQALREVEDLKREKQP